MRASDRTGIAVIFSVFLSTFTITPLTEDSSFLGASWLLILILGGATIWLRRNRIGSGTVIGVQLMILLAAVGVLSAGMPGEGEQWYWHVPDLWQVGIEHMRTQASPMEPNDGVKLIFVTVIGVIMIMTDLLVSGIGRPVWAIAPPATLFLVPAIGLGTDTGALSFLCIAVGYLAILIAEGLNSTARWTRGLTRDSAEGFGTATPVVWRAASYLGIPALGAVLVLGLALPTLSLPGFGIGNGPGNGGPLQLTDPTLDLRRNLTQPNNREVIEYQTDAPGGVYLRLTSLPQFGATGWTSVQIRLSSGSTLPSIPGVSNEGPDKRSTTIRVLDFRSQYLPLPYAPRTVQAGGDWRYDANSLIVVNGNDRPDALRNLTYSVTSVDIAPDGDNLNKAPAGTPADASITGAIPRDLPDSLINLARQVTADAKTPVAKAAAIQAYLRSSRFTYSTEPLPGSGYQAMENFLLVDRKGYCEQFATSMAMMARVVGIPSRVSVGFLPGHQNGDRWEVSIRDMHAWPELYFAGYGWVRFEPTPASVTGAAPSWSVPDAGRRQGPVGQPDQPDQRGGTERFGGAVRRPDGPADDGGRAQAFDGDRNTCRRGCRAAGAVDLGGAGDDPGASAQRPALRGPAGRGAGRVRLGRDQGHGAGLPRNLAGRITADDRPRDRRAARGSGVGRHVAGGDACRAFALLPKVRRWRGSARSAGHHRGDPAGHRRAAAAAPTGVRLPAAAVDLPPPAQGSGRSEAVPSRTQKPDSSRRRRQRSSILSMKP